MKKGYILTGDPVEIEKVIRENRVRANRGKVKFSPIESETAMPENCIETLKEVVESRGEEVRQMIISHQELAALTSEVLLIAAANGVSMSEEIKERLNTFGIIVPDVSEADAVSEDAATDTEKPVDLDNNNIDTDDLQEVDMDELDKSVAISDTKEIAISDTKTPKKRPKKS